MTDRQPPEHEASEFWQDGVAPPRRSPRAPRGHRGKRPRGKRRASGPRWLAAAAYVGVGAACLVLAAATFLLVAAPVDIVRDRLAQAVKQRTGRDLIIAGTASISLVPRIGVVFADVSLSAPPAMEGPPTLTAQSVDVEVGLWSLLTQQIAVKRLTLNRPVIDLRIDAQGRRSWDFAGGPKTTRLAQLGSADGLKGLVAQAQDQPAGDGQRVAAIFDRSMPSSLRIVDATVRYRDERAGAAREFGSVDLDIALSDVSGPVEAKGSVSAQGDKISLEARVLPLRALLAQEIAKLDLRVSGQAFEATYQGAMALAPAFALDGQASVKAPDAGALGAWLGRPLARDGGMLSAAGSMRVANGQIALSGLSATLGEVSLSGSLVFDTKTGRPYARGNLEVSQIDFGKLFLRSAASAAPADAQPVIRPAGGQDGPLAGSRRKDAEIASLPGKRARGWSDQVTDLSPLALGDADVTLSAGQLLYKDLKTGPSRLALALKDKVATITLEDTQLYGGRGRGVLTLDGSGEIPVSGTNLALENVAVLPMLRDALGFEWLEGRGTLTLALASQGASERERVETMNGKVDIAVRNGAILGIDLPKIVRSLEQGRVSGLGAAPGEKTPFSELAGSFAIGNGAAQNQNLRLTSQQLQVAGAGTFNLPQRQIDYTVRPKITASPSGGQATVVNLAGLEVPVRITGPWDKPVFTPVLKDVLKSSGPAGDTLKQIGKNLKNPEVQEAVKGLLGGGEGQQRVKPRELLEKLLKKD